MGESSEASRRPIWTYSAATQKKMIKVSGVFRTSVTYAAPKPRNTPMGETRQTATRVPTSSAPMAEITVNLMVIQNAPSTSYSASRSNIPPIRPPSSLYLG